MQTPDITKAQILAAVFAAFYPALTLLGIDLNAEQKDALDQLWAVALGLFGADAIIRYGRSRLLSGGSGVVIDDFDPEDPEGERLREKLPQE